MNAIPSYRSFLKHSRRAERAAGRHVIEVIEAGQVARLLPDPQDGSPGWLVAASGTFKGTDRTIDALIRLSGAAHERQRDAIATWRAVLGK
jgi:hypothetical protein